MSLVPTIHATSIVLGTHGVLIRGKSGSGKTALALQLLGRAGSGNYTALISDDRTMVCPQNGRLIARSVETIAGLAEIRGIGIIHARRQAAGAVVTLVLDLVDTQDVARLPAMPDRTTCINGMSVPLIQLPDAVHGSLEAKTEAILAVLDLSHACRPRSVDG